jgi:hypothetical protein
MVGVLTVMFAIPWAVADMEQDAGWVVAPMGMAATNGLPLATGSLYWLIEVSGGINPRY